MLDRAVGWLLGRGRWPLSGVLCVALLGMDRRYVCGGESDIASPAAYSASGLRGDGIPIGVTEGD